MLIGSIMYCKTMINELFKDRTGIITADSMYPTKIKHKTPKDLFSLFFTHGDSTSIVIDGETFTLSISDGNALLSPSHTSYWDASTFENVLMSCPALSVYNFSDAVNILWKLYSIPDTLITSPDSTMVQKAREIMQHYNVKMGWNLKHVVCPQLKDNKKWRWFVVDSRKSTAHYKKLSAGFCELCVFTPDWIVGSLSTTMPVLPE